MIREKVRLRLWDGPRELHCAALAPREPRTPAAPSRDARLARANAPVANDMVNRAEAQSPPDLFYLVYVIYHSVARYDRQNVEERGSQVIQLAIHHKCCRCSEV